MSNIKCSQKISLKDRGSASLEIARLFYNITGLILLYYYNLPEIHLVLRTFDPLATILEV